MLERNQALAVMGLAIAALAGGLIILFKQKRPETVLEPSCTCKCGSKYYKVNLPPNSSDCKAVEGAECVSKNGNRHKLRNCSWRYALAAQEDMVAA